MGVVIYRFSKYLPLSSLPPSSTTLISPSSYAGTLEDEFAFGTMSPSAYLRSISLRETIRRARMDQGSASELGAGVW